MALFKKNGGLMNEIRCDEQDYLIWKWRPQGSISGVNSRENAIRLGSSLRVRDGSVAVFVYKQKDGTVQDYIEGPYDQILSTKNIPFIASAIGLAYDGGTPFQAEVYFINLASIIQIKFAVPFFDVFDPRFLDFGVPTAVRGTLTFNIKDYKGFIKLHRMDEFSPDAFQNQVRDAIVRYVKAIIANAPMDFNLPVVQIDRRITEINDAAMPVVVERLGKDFGVNVTGLDIAAIEIDKTSDGFQRLMAVTRDISSVTVQAQTQVNIKNLEDQQRINAENLDETLRIQREETQYAQRKQSQTSYFDAYKLEQQAAVGIAGAEALGNMGASASMGSGSGGGDGLNPGAMMAGLAMGGAIGQNMAGMMNGMMNGMSQTIAKGQTPPPIGTGQTPPPIPITAYYVAQNSQPAGPFDMRTLSQMAREGTLTVETLVWKEGMSNWVKAGSVEELAKTLNPMPPIPADASTGSNEHEQ
ncbi:SPFH domain-containing protein [Adlercreutzia sp. ZJ141]|uniref:SPFH domain-containing protein n=1 Tax=Adlercreutzia sp. ZJ141 TaxID=2709406 RepID=UPI0013ED2A35|nr:SPFH domain-containing protein [Adlercreutzia sp. ZJ141]